MCMVLMGFVVAPAQLLNEGVGVNMSCKTHDGEAQVVVSFQCSRRQERLIERKVEEGKVESKLATSSLAFNSRIVV
jgi:hypothetical protein